jgi:hypothetical protein
VDAAIAGAAVNSGPGNDTKSAPAARRLHAGAEREAGNANVQGRACYRWISSARLRRCPLGNVIASM